jgi:hypothetical protein
MFCLDVSGLPQYSNRIQFAMQLTFKGFTQSEKHLSSIRNLYWMLRAIRPGQGAKRRKLYRQIAKEKAVLIADGFDSEALRLWCRQFSRCHPEAATARFHHYLTENEIIFENTL